MKMPWTNRTGPAKLLAVCASVLLVAGGLCGVQYAVVLASSNQLNFLLPVFIFTGMAELAAIVLSLAGLVIGAMWLIVKAIRDHGPGAGSSEDQND
jgi:hypothetical protein